ncbi:hypothetical protein QFZ34_003908 [Phyllobacterium ifriqiyense]|uniref:Uncharacterized protein n=1 Tax=Phyllobacterium ifriqiyense TaxID=314238 RepID=A0ABU0SDL4_9HYPH|nr:hypothetical protein [Phyllobacterium ifriqiyense]
MGEVTLHTPHNASCATPQILQKVRSEMPTKPASSNKLSDILKRAKGGFTHRRFKQHSK